MEFKWIHATDSNVFTDASDIRRKVFIDEQKVSEAIEYDGLDDSTMHVVGYVDGKPVVTARILSLVEGEFRLQRIATLKEERGKGYGNLLLDEIKRYLKEKYNAKHLELHSQDHAIPFYEKNGFIVEGEGFVEADIPHHQMTFSY